MNTPGTAPNGAPISKAFTRTPVNPYQQRAAEQRAAMQNNGDPQPQPQPQPQPTPPPTPQPALVPPPAKPNPITPPPAPQPTPQPPVPPTAPTPAPSPAPTLNHDEMYRQMEAQFQAQLQRERQMWEQDKAQLNQTIQNLTQRSNEYDQLKAQQEMAQALSDEAFAGLEGVDVEDARRIGAVALTAANAQMANMRKEMEEQRKLLQQGIEHQQAEAMKLRIQQLNSEVLAQHPDFFNIMQTPEYRTFMSQRDGYSSKTRDQRAAEEYANGNSAYVINLLNELKGTRPNVQDVMSVAPVQTAQQPVANTPVPGAPQYTLKELNDLYQMRHITHEQYREALKQLRAANSF